MDDNDDGDDGDDDDDDDTALHSRSPVALFGVDNGGNDNDGGQTSFPDFADSGVKVSVVVPKYVIAEHGFTNLSL